MAQSAQQGYDKTYTEEEKNGYIGTRVLVDSIEALSLRYFFSEKTEDDLEARINILDDVLRPVADKLKEMNLMEQCEPGMMECNGVCVPETSGCIVWDLPPEG